MTVGPLSGEGTVRLDVNAAGTGIADAAGNVLTGGFTAGSGLHASAGRQRDVAARAQRRPVERQRQLAGRDRRQRRREHRDVQHDRAGRRQRRRSSTRRGPSATSCSAIPIRARRATGSSTTTAIAANMLTLAVAGGAPTLTVNALGAGAAARLAASLAGTAGLTKIGPGTLVLDRANTLTGAINVNGGTLRLDPGSSLNTGAGTVNVARRRRRAPARQRRLDLGRRPGHAGRSGGVAGLFTLDSGTATFGAVRTNSDFGSTFRINGGTFFATDVNIRRNSAAAVGLQLRLHRQRRHRHRGHHRPRHQQLQRRADGGRWIADRDGRGHHRQPGHRRPRRGDARDRRHRSPR